MKLITRSVFVFRLTIFIVSFYSIAQAEVIYEFPINTLVKTMGFDEEMQKLVVPTARPFEGYTVQWMSPEGTSITSIPMLPPNYESSVFTSVPNRVSPNGQYIIGSRHDNGCIWDLDELTDPVLPVPATELQLSDTDEFWFLSPVSVANNGISVGQQIGIPGYTPTSWDSSGVATRYWTPFDGLLTNIGRISSITANGQIKAGFVNVIGTLEPQAFSWESSSDGNYLDLGTMPGGLVLFLSHSGELATGKVSGPGVPVWVDEVFQSIPTSHPLTAIEGSGITDSGWIIGTALLGNDQVSWIHNMEWSEARLLTEYYEEVTSLPAPGDMKYVSGLVATEEFLSFIVTQEGSSAPVYRIIRIDLQTSELPGDVNGDGSVGVDDLLLILSGWGECPAEPAECAGDLNGNGFIGVDDLLLVLSNWGATA